MIEACCKNLLLKINNVTLVYLVTPIILLIFSNNKSETNSVFFKHFDFFSYAKQLTFCWDDFCKSKWKITYLQYDPEYPSQPVRYLWYRNTVSKQ